MQLNRRHNTNFTNDDVPTAPFTEEDVRDNPDLIALIVFHLLSYEERSNIEPEALLRRQLEQVD